MKYLKKLALVLCLFAVFNLGFSVLFPNKQAFADTPTSPTDCDTTKPNCVPSCGYLDECLSTTGGPDSSVCAAGSHTGLEWLFCPITMALGKFTDTINNTVQSLLDFQVNNYLADSTTTHCGPDSCQVNKAWVVMKNIVSGLVIILMLVMVISQAAGGQMFDAYTVKKMLPRLAIAVIAIQFSWVLSKWMISSVNDIAHGIKDLMLAPFGGAQNMSLSAIMNHLDSSFPIATSWAIIGILILLLLTPFATFILPVFLFALIAVGGAVIIALATLVFRNAFIVMAVIFAPVALLLWATPGQTFQGLWKKYADNVVKILFLFPLIMAMIYAGRIVAWVTAGLSGTSDLLSFFVILVAFFAPYVILPKTFKWGGQILGAVNQEMNNNRVTRAAKGWAYGRARSEAVRRSAQQGAKWDPDDDYLRRGRTNMRFNPNSRIGKALFSKLDENGERVGRRNLLAHNALFSKKMEKLDNEGNVIGKERVGRRNLFKLEGRKIQGLAGGALLDKGLSNEGMLKRSEQHKSAADEASETRKKRAIEAGRNRSNAAIMFFRDSKTGEISAMAYEKGKGPYSISAGMANAMAGINSPEWRDDGEFAKLLLHPESGIYAKNRVLMDPSNRAWKKRKELEKKYGLKGEYDPERNANDRKLSNELGELSKRRSRYNELTAKQRRGQLTEEEGAELNSLTPLSAGEEARLSELDTLMTLRKGRARKLSNAEINQIKAHIATVKRTNPEAIEAADGAWASLNVDENGVAVAKADQAVFVPFTKHPAVTKKATSVPELTQAIAGIAPADLPIVMEKWAQSGYSYDNDPDSPIGVGNYNWKDMYAYFISDHDNMQREYGQNEAEEKELAIRFKKGKQEYDIGKIGHNNYGDPAMFGADERLDLYLRNLERQDSTTAQVLSGKMATESTRIPFGEGFADGTLNPGDLFGEGHDDSINILNYLNSRPPEERKYWKAYVQKMFKNRRQLGIRDWDARKTPDRDLLIAQDTPRYRYYDPTWTAEQTRDIYDSEIDPAGATEPVPIAANEDALRERMRAAGIEDWLPPETTPQQQAAKDRVIERYEARYGRARPAPGAAEPTPPVEPEAAGGAAAEARIQSRTGGVPPVSYRPGGEAASRAPEGERLQFASGGPAAEARIAASAPPPVIINRETIVQELASRLQRPPIAQEIDLAALQQQFKQTGDSSLRAQIAQKMREINEVNPPLPQSNPTYRGANDAPPQLPPTAQAGGSAAPSAPGPLPAAAAPTINPLALPSIPQTTKVVQQTTVVRNIQPSSDVSVRSGAAQGELAIQHGQATAPQVGTETASMRARIAQDELRHAIQDTMRAVAKNQPGNRATQANPDKVADDIARRAAQPRFRQL